MIGLRRLRRLRDRSSVLKAVHAVLREPYYKALCLLHRRGVKVELPGRCSVRLHPLLLGIPPEEYEPELSAALDGRIARGMTVLDVGSHVGLHSLRFSQAVGAAGHVVAVEASPANAALLRTHLLWNDCRNVTVIEAAVAEQKGEMEFAYRTDPTDYGAFANSIAYDIGGEKASVRVTTIDEICRGLTPQVIKIDIEGAELLALRGARELLSSSAPVLFIAVHPEPMKALGTSPSELVEFLRGFGYAGWRLDGSPAIEPSLEEIVFEKQSSALRT
jgi:FkbM family methyltransferase